MSDAHEDGQRRWTRRGWLSAASAAVVGTAIADGNASAPETAQTPPPAAAALPLTDFQPNSMLHVAETKVERPRFPVIDIHTQSRGGARPKPAGRGGGGETMDAGNLRTMVNLTGGVGRGPVATIARSTAPIRAASCRTEPAWTAREPGYAQSQADEITTAKAAGAEA